MSEAIRQEIEINAPVQTVFGELLQWGESSWWPKGSLMTFRNLSGRVNENTVYLQKVKFPLGPWWHTRNENVDYRQLSVKRLFLDGMFTGYEELRVQTQEREFPKAIYEFHYQVKGFLSRLMWEVLFKKLHIKNIENILEALKKYVEVKK